MTAPVTDITAVGGFENDFISVKLFCKNTDINIFIIKKNILKNVPVGTSGQLQRLP